MKNKYIFYLVLGAAVFISVAYLTQTKISELENFIGGYRNWGVLIYISLAILATVFAPLTTVPLIPLVSGIYGWFWAAIFSIIGWLLGSMLAFYIARKYGKGVVKRFVSLEEVEKIEDAMPHRKKFINLILLRIFLPVDILTYALGLFTKIDFKLFLSTTLIGIIPFAFIMSYLGYLPWQYQIIGWAVIGIIIVLGIRFIFSKK